MKKANLFILGAPKCGTTSFANYLDKHPSIFLSSAKEPHYFNTDSKNRFTFTEKQYLKNFEEANETHKFKIDASVWYLFSEVAVPNILKYNPDAKFIVMLRNPTDMFFSLYQQFLFSGKETQKSPKKAWDMQQEREEGKHIPISCYDPQHLQYKKVCSLGQQITQLSKQVSLDQVHFIIFDDLKEKPNQVYQEVIKFLKLPALSLDSYHVHNKKKERSFYWLAFFLKVVNRAKQKLNIRKGVGLANLIERKNKKQSSGKHEEEFKEMRPMLIKAFREDVSKIETITNRQLNNWKEI